MANSIFGLLKKQMEEDKQKVISLMIDGVAKDHAEYKWFCGQLLGLAKAQYLVDVMVDRLKQQDGDLDD